MKNYRSVSLNRIKDFETYAEKKLKAGHIIIEILCCITDSGTL